MKIAYAWRGIRHTENLNCPITCKRGYLISGAFAHGSISKRDNYFFSVCHSPGEEGMESQYITTKWLTSKGFVLRELREPQAQAGVGHAPCGYAPK